MIRTSARLLQLLGLLQSGQEWTAPRLAERLNIQPRTVRRDVDRLRELGYPVSARRGAFGGYRLGGERGLLPLMLDEDEALAVAVGLRSAAVGSVSGAQEAAGRALAKLDEVLPSAVRGRLASLDAGLVTLQGGASLVSGDDIAAILRACDLRVRLRFRYSSREGEESDRDTEPYRLVQAGRHWYLVAWDLSRGQWRTFRVDRIDDLRASTFHFALREPDEDAATMVSRAVSTAPYRFQVRVLLSADAGRLRELVPPTVGVVVPAEPGESLLLTGSDSLISIAVHLLSLDTDMRILGPPELIDLMGRLGHRLIAAVKGLR
ncbi:putative DNA-binding transcriptional regulator YafY [Nakamurella sp. UYEF19]|uniref:helix-turn-helix transcriptional regulator n=1 Tax=Nakamurella sp. UYEF19 TaxID=1756392 RepID=UPI0033936926